MLLDEQAPYYTQFRKKLSDYSDIALARITKEQEKELEKSLTIGHYKWGEKIRTKVFLYVIDRTIC